MKIIKINCKITFWLWIVTYAIMCVILNASTEDKTRIITLGNAHVEIARPEYALLMAVLILIWFLPLAVVTYRNAIKTNKGIRLISRGIIFWLSLSLLVSLLILILGGGQIVK